ncbi:TetR/AcrR family transcriptional regulator [Nocardia sp. NPDC059236]
MSARAVAEGPPPDRRDRRRQEIRDRILSSALELFADQGYAATTVDQIAARADLARRTVYNHFARKQDMLAVWAADRRALASAWLVDGADRESARDQLALQFEALAHANETDPRMAKVLAMGWLTELGTFEGPFPVFESFVVTIRNGQASGEFEPSPEAEIVAEVLSACYTDTLQRWLQAAEHSRIPFPLAPALHAKLGLILDGLARNVNARP